MFSDLEARGYVTGGGLLSPAGIFYLNIPKNASTFLTNVLTDNGWVYHVLGDGSHLIKECMVVLRDPIDRWISGFSTYASSCILGPHYGSDLFLKDYNILAERIIFDNLSFDDHTAPQTRYIAQLPPKPVTYFKLTSKTIPQIGRFTGVELKVVNKVDANVSENNYDQRQISELIRKRVNEDVELKSKIIQRYKNDYDLISQIPFYYDPL